MKFLNSNPYLSFIDKSSERITIDCGHTHITIKDKKIVFGKEGLGPSSSELETLKIALVLTTKLLDQNKEVLINFCFSDVGNAINPEIRSQLKKQFFQNYFLELLPKCYQELIAKFPGNIAFNFNFQSSNSNYASSVIKKIKKKINMSSFDEILDRYNCFFLLRDNSTFGFTCPNF